MNDKLFVSSENNDIKIIFLNILFQFSATARKRTQD